MGNATTDPRYRALVGLCGFCGCRVHEAIAVWPHDIEDFGILHIEGKGAKERRVPIPRQAMVLISGAYLVAQAEGRTLVSLGDSAAREAITRLGAHARIPRPVASHDLRATFATMAWNRMVDAGSPDPLTLQRLLGHAKFDTTAGYIGSEWAAMQAAVGA